LTFSIVARDPETKALGVCVCTAIPAVGSAVPHVELDTGAIATQAQTNVQYGIEGLRLLKQGLTPKTVLDTIMQKDRDREKRQVIIIDAQGRTAAFTGSETVEWKGHLISKDHIVAGNMLVGNRVVEAMTKTFEAERGNLAERLLKAVEAGQEAGGEKRGHMSAALLVADKRWKSETRPLLDLRVDAHPDPVRELRRVYAISTEYFHISE